MVSSSELQLSESNNYCACVWSIYSQGKEEHFIPCSKMTTCLLVLLIILSSADDSDFTSVPTEEATSTLSNTFSSSNCEGTIDVNITETYLNLSELKDDLVIPYNKIVRNVDSVMKRRKTVGKTFNLSETFVNSLKDTLMKARVLNSAISCPGNLMYKKYTIDFMEEFEQKLEVTQRLLDVLQKIGVNDTDSYEGEFTSDNNEDRYQAAIEDSLLQIQSLYNIIGLNSDINTVNVSLMKHYSRYVKADDILDLEVIISLTKQIIKIFNEILQIIENTRLTISSNGSEVGESNVISQLLSTSYWRDKVKKRENFLIASEERYAEDRILNRLKYVIRPTVLGIIFLIGIVGNGVLLLVFIFNKDMRVAPNMMVINLTLADFLCLFVNIPLYILETQKSRIHGHELCKFYIFSRFLTIGLSVYSVVVISLQRYLVLSGFQRMGKITCGGLGMCNPLLFLVLVWVVASALASPRAAKASYFQDECVSGTGEDIDTFFKPIAIADLIFYCIFPLLVVTASTGLTSKRLKKSVINMPGEAMGRERAAKARVLSSNVLLALTIVFGISYVPYFAYTVYYHWYIRVFKPETPYTTQKYLSFFLYALIFLNACINPVALYLVSRKYRRHMNRYILFCGSKNRKRKVSMDTNATSTTNIETKM